MTPRIRPWLFWILLFVAVNVLFPQMGNPNPGSRLAAMAAFCETGTFTIDDYVAPPDDWTNDWSHSPNGHYYSNKAPGPMLIGLPIFWLVDHSVVAGLGTAQERFLQRRRSLALYNRVLSILLQVIPFAVLAGLVLSRLDQNGLSNGAIHFAALALLYGNTASLLMNTYFGHGMAAVWLLGLWLSLENDRWRWIGFCAGWAALCDYGALLVVGILLVVAVAMGGRSNGKHPQAFELLLGLLVPVMVWILYHTIAFGRPWRLPLQFQSPEFVDMASQPGVLWGILTWIPDPKIFLRLLGGLERGLLVTQPWLLLSLPLGLATSLKKTEPKSSSLGPMGVWLFPLSFVLILLANASFGGWQGGRTIGPRYVSIFIPVLAAQSAYAYDRIGRSGRIVLWVLLAPALAFAGLVYTTTLYVPPGLALWPALWAFFKMRYGFV